MSRRSDEINDAIDGAAVHDLPPGVAPPHAPQKDAPPPLDEERPPPPPPPEDAAAAADVEENPDGSTLGAARLLSVVESLLLVSDRPVTLERLRELLPGQPALTLREALRGVERRYQEGGIRLLQVAGGYQLRTAPENAAFVQKLLQAKPVRLSRAQVETLAIVAYRQPITRPEVDDIRGVDSGAALKSLLERHLVRILGKKEEPGRPILYGTTREFLEFFNLRDLRDLPTLREFYELSEEHQAKVAAAGGDPLDLEDAPAPAAAEPNVPPPLGRVELKDLNLEDDESQSREIDEMINAVRTDFPLAEVLGTALGQAPGAEPAAEAHEEDPEDDRGPEEL